MSKPRDKQSNVGAQGYGAKTVRLGNTISKNERKGNVKNRERQSAGRKKEKSQ